MSFKAKDLDSHKNTIISVSIISDEEIRAFNKKHLERDYPTDVLSFSIEEPHAENKFYLGDIVVNKDQAKRQCVEYKNTYEQEIADLVAHGVLHLLGVHHADDDDVSVHGIRTKK